ncbi:hypothetical protein OEZ77_26230, partial [Leclercia adecarboxylata]|uniref:hypothetical protein n=1 Tax=Leclercia adecarboxylata TaxID=83655 RepID=UPI00234D2621
MVRRFADNPLQLNMPPGSGSNACAGNQAYRRCDLAGVLRVIFARCNCPQPSARPHQGTSMEQFRNIGIIGRLGS